MNIIRFNRRTLYKLIILFIVYIGFRTVLDYLYQLENPSLEYDYSKREFLLTVPKSVLQNDLKSQRTSNDFYIIDQGLDYNENAKIKFQIKSAKFYYSKIFLEDWVKFLENAVNLGLNTIEIEIVWNIHEQNPGGYDFKSNNLDIEELIKLVKAYKLLLLIRIDPYLPCSDYDMGGLPNWLIAESDLEKREKDSGSLYALLNLKHESFGSFYSNFLHQLMPFILKYQFVKNGPIIGILIQNYETNDKNSYQNFYNQMYKKYILQFLRDYGFTEIILKSINLCEYNRFYDKLNFQNFCDPTIDVYFPLDFKFIDKNIQLNHQDCTNSYFVHHYDETLKPIDIIEMQKIKFRSNLVEMIKTEKSFGIKTFYCYSNKGFSNSPSKSIAQFNKYQYCLIDQNGNKTSKFQIAYNVLNKKSELIPKEKNNLKFIRQYADWSSIDNQDLIDIPITHILPFKNLVDYLHTPTSLKDSKEELFMEYLNIVYSVKSTGLGYILYRIKASLRAGSQIVINTFYLRDYSVLICDYNYHVLTVDSSKTNKTMSLKLRFDCNELHVLVENKGRLSELNDKISFSDQRKGILARDAIMFKRPDKDVYEIGGVAWRINFFDFMPKFFNRVTFNSQYMSYDEFLKSKLKNLNNPIMGYAKFYAKKTNHQEHVYLVLKDWTRAVVFLNGFNLGKYSGIEKLNPLFVPKKLLNSGSNEIVIFDLHGFANNQIPKIFLTKGYLIV